MSIPGSASPLFIGAAAEAAAAYQIDRSIRINDDDTAYLNRTPSSTGNRKTWTWSAWVKRGKLSAEANLFSVGASSTDAAFRFNGDDTLKVRDGGGGELVTNAVFKDPSAWYHIVVSLDNTQSTSTERFKLWINGVEQTYSSASYASQNTDGDFNTAVAHYIGRQVHNTSNLFDGYLAEVHWVDGGTQLAASDFGEYDSNNVWQPKDCQSSLTYGTNGFYLKFADNSSNAALGTDSSGNSNTWTVNNIAAQGSTHAVAGTHSGKAGISFNGTNAEITLTSDSDVNPGSGVFTLECYAYAASGGNAELGIYDGSPGGNGSFVLRRVGAGTLMVERHNTAFDITGAAFSENTWHHVAVTRDSSNNVRLFVDGNQSGSTSNNTHNYQGTFRLGRTNNAFTNGYISNLRLIKGTCLYTSNFTAPTGNLSNVTNTKLLMAQSTTSATAATVKPSGVTISGAGDSSIIDSLIDTPTNYTADSGNNGGNYCTLNPLDRQSTNGTLSNGNLDIKQTTTQWAMYRSTMFVSSGKWYWECTLGNNQYSTIGIVSDEYSMGQYTNAWVNQTADMFGYYPYNGSKYNGSSGVSYATADTSASGSVIGVALDMDNGTLAFYKDGTSLGTAYTGLTGKNVSPTHWLYNQSNADSYNFGQRPFAYTPPTDHLSLCTTNLPDPTIADGSTAFDATLWTGNGGTQTISGLNHSPDFIWHKIRSIAGGSQLYDSVRGTSKRLRSDSTAAESTLNGVTAFNSDGWTMTAGNNNNETYVSWTWDAGTSTASNTDGSITSNVRVNQSAGFSIATYTGNGTNNSTVGHGLNAAPSWVIIKNRSNAYGWAVLHTSAGTTGTTLDGSAEYYMLQLDSNAARNDFTNDNIWNPTSSTFKINGSGTGNWVNANGDNYVAYSWTPVSGYSSFGSYIGNGNATIKPYVHVGFRPAFILIKAVDISGKSWLIYDKARDGYNRNNDDLAPDLSNQENDVVGSANSIDIFSNGFQPISDNSRLNQSGAQYVFACFASHPFKTARAR